MKERPVRLETKVRLLVLGFDGSAEAISNVLGVQPTKAWRKGDPVIENATNRQPSNGWMLASPVDPKSTAAEEALGALLALLPDRGAFSRLPDGTQVQMTFTLFGYEERPYLDLSWSAIKGLAEIGASLDVDVYDLTETTS